MRPISTMRVGTVEFWPLEDADPNTPIYEQVCARHMSRPGNWPDMHAPTDSELDYLVIHRLQRVVLRHLWTSPSRPVCGAAHRATYGTLDAKRTVHYVCLLPPQHEQNVHYAPDEQGGYQWPVRVYG